MGKVLGRIRLSRLTDESTSEERQREVIQQWADANGHTIVSWAIDMDVSGSVDPFDTRGLGPWLTAEKQHEWDILAAWKLDRLGRDAIRLNKLFGWCIDHGKTVASCTEGIDLSTPVGRLIANVIAFLAEGEREAIRERVTGSHRKLRELGRWPGGKPAYGYAARERIDAAGWELVPDEHAAAVLSGIIDKVLAGNSIESIARDLTASGELSPSDYMRQRSGGPTRNHPWRRQTLIQLLRSRTLLGYVTHAGTTVRDSQGVPVQKGPPLVSLARFDQLQSALAGRTWQRTVRTVKASPMLGVALCGATRHIDGCRGWGCDCPLCETPLHYRRQTTKGTEYRYYGCPDGHKPNMPAGYVEDAIAEQFLDEVGDDLVQIRVFVPADNHSTELDEAVRAVDELTALIGTMTSDTMRKRLTGQLSALDSRIAELESMPESESHWEYQKGTETYRESWNRGDTEQRRQLLLKSGFTATVRLFGKSRGSGGAWEVNFRVPEDIKERLSA